MYGIMQARFNIIMKYDVELSQLNYSYYDYF